MKWEDETSWWAWALLGLCIALIGIIYLTITIDALPSRDAEGYILMPTPSRSLTGGKVRVPMHFAFGWSFTFLILSVFFLWKAYKSLMD
ncbi:MAG: hypothetical protein NZ531_00420, partial [Aquificaceae bacterium]|nr:hypothetical protein [Aquificaceae bacterium]